VRAVIPLDVRAIPQRALRAAVGQGDRTTAAPRV